jgi:hypothetical protein
VKELEWLDFERTLESERSIARRPMFRKSQMMKNAEAWLAKNKTKIEEYEAWKLAKRPPPAWKTTKTTASKPKKNAAIADKPLVAKKTDFKSLKSATVFKSKGLVNLSRPMSKGARKAEVMRMALEM